MQGERLVRLLTEALAEAGFLLRLLPRLFASSSRRSCWFVHQLCRALLLVSVVDRRRLRLL